MNRIYSTSNWQRHSGLKVMYSFTLSFSLFVLTVCQDISINHLFTTEFSYFVRNYLEKLDLAIIRKSDSYFEDLIESDSLRDIFLTMSVKKGILDDSESFLVEGHGEDFRLIKRIRHQQSGDFYTSSIKNTTLDFRFVLGAIFRGGYSLVVNKMQEKSAKIRKFVDDLRSNMPIGYVINVNLYLTPGNSSQGFEAHMDWMDGIILQIAGCKTWHLFDFRGPLFPREDIIVKPTATELALLTPRKVTLYEGSVMYLPRGLVHEAATNCSFNPRDPSVHLTVGLELANSGSLEVFMQLVVEFIFQHLGLKIFEEFSFFLDDSSQVEVLLQGINSIDIMHAIIYKVSAAHSDLRTSVFNLRCKLIFNKVSVNSSEILICLRKVLRFGFSIVHQSLNSNLVNDTLILLKNVFDNSYTESTFSDIQVKDKMKIHRRLIEYLSPASHQNATIVVRSSDTDFSDYIPTGLIDCKMSKDNSSCRKSLNTHFRMALEDTLNYLDWVIFDSLFMDKLKCEFSEKIIYEALSRMMVHTTETKTKS